MSEDSANFPKSRSDLFIKGRIEMTQNPAIVETFQHTLAQAKKDGIATELAPSNRDDLDRTMQGLRRLTKNFLGGDTSFSEENLLETAELFFSLGERMAPFYDGVAQWFNSFRSSDIPTQFIFQGRDCLGFFLAFVKRYGTSHAHYSPVNRRSYKYYYDKLTPEQKTGDEERLEQEYQDKDYLDKKLVFTDFGFKGTGARRELLQIKHKLGRLPKEVEIALAYHEPEVVDTVAEYYIPGSFPPENYGEYGDINTNLINNHTHGYINTHVPQIVQALQSDFEFSETLQELTSYIKETSAIVDAGEKPRAQDYIVAPVYEFAAKYGFIHGLKSRLQSGMPENSGAVEAKDALVYFQNLYTRYPGLFSLIQDHNRRGNHNNTYNEIVKKLNDELEDMGGTLYRG